MRLKSAKALKVRFQFKDCILSKSEQDQGQLEYSKFDCNPEIGC